MIDVAHAPERLWRARKHHTWIDARVHLDERDGVHVDLQLFYDGTLILDRRCESRDQAVTDAAMYLRQLQRSGWNTHW